MAYIPPNRRALNAAQSSSVSVSSSVSSSASDSTSALLVPSTGGLGNRTQLQSLFEALLVQLPDNTAPTSQCLDHIPAAGSEVEVATQSRKNLLSILAPALDQLCQLSFPLAAWQVVPSLVGAIFARLVVCALCLVSSQDNAENARALSVRIMQFLHHCLSHGQQVPESSLNKLIAAITSILAAPIDTSFGVLLQAEALSILS